MNEKRLKRLKNMTFALLLTLFSTIFCTSLAFANSDLSTIAGQPIKGLKDKEVRGELSEYLYEWEQYPFIIHVGEDEIELPRSYIQVDVDETVERFIGNRSTPWYKVWESPRPYDGELVVTIDSGAESLLSDYSTVDAEATIEKARTMIATELATSIAAEGSALADLEQRLSIVSEKAEQLAPDVNGMASTLAYELVLPAGESVSILELFEENNYSDEALSFFASTVYNAVLETNYIIQERHDHFEIFEPFGPGREAMIEKSTQKDLRIYNTNVVDGTIRFEMKGDELEAALYSIPLDVDVSVTERGVEKIPPRVVRHYPTVEEREGTVVPKTSQAGREGVSLKVVREIRNKSTGQTTEEVVADVTYPPVHHIEVVPYNDLEGYGEQDNAPDTNNEAQKSDAIIPSDGRRKEDDQPWFERDDDKDGGDGKGDGNGGDGSPSGTNGGTGSTTAGGTGGGNGASGQVERPPIPDHLKNQVDDRIFDKNGPDTLDPNAQYDKAGNRIR
ncbi:hypothetical protein GOP80_09765 [Planococcaceae bacterium Storch 2/2-2]|nr:hypothetical protein [Planococcaceae bacterium Storch 2/2-2]